VVNIKEVYVKDKEWFTEYIKVEGKHITKKSTTKRWWITPNQMISNQPPDKRTIFSSGTFALQGHDPNSEVHFKNIMVKVAD
jgi:hypothetical protein